MVGLERLPIEMHGNVLWGPIHNDGLHRGTDGGPDEFLRHAVPFEDGTLSCCRAATVTAHGGNQKRLTAQRAHMLDN